MLGAKLHVHYFEFWRLPENRNVFVELPVPSRPVRSLTQPLPDPYPTLTRLASLGLSRSHKGTGTDTIFDFSHPPTHH